MTRFADVIFWTIIAAIIFSMVRPGSPAGAAMTAITTATAAVVGTATGYTTGKGAQ